MEATREKIIISLLKKGNTYTNVGKMFKVSKQRIHQIAERNNISPRKIKKEKYKRIIQKIKKDINLGVTPTEIIKKYKLNTNTIEALKNYGFNIHDMERVLKGNRNKTINSLFLEGMTALDIMRLYPSYKTEGAIYAIARKFNNGVLPTRTNTYDTKLITIKDTIKKLKSDGLTPSQIAKKMNELNITSSSGKPMTRRIVKYHYDLV